MSWVDHRDRTERMSSLAAEMARIAILIATALKEFMHIKW
jgi:hypothetical protein